MKDWILHNGEEEVINKSVGSRHKVLGLSWDSTRDCFKYYQEEETAAKYTTKWSNSLTIVNNYL